MPIYKVYRYGVAERRHQRSLARWRWMALALSAGLLTTAAMMLSSSH